MTKDFFKGCAAFYFSFALWSAQHAIYLEGKRHGINIYDEQHRDLFLFWLDAIERQ